MSVAGRSNSIGGEEQGRSEGCGCANGRVVPAHESSEEIPREDHPGHQAEGAGAGEKQGRGVL